MYGTEKVPTLVTDDWNHHYYSAATAPTTVHTVLLKASGL
jgi:hypothetical protein